jgi:hypothetical protein
MEDTLCRTHATQNLTMRELRAYTHSKEHVSFSQSSMSPLCTILNFTCNRGVKDESMENDLSSRSARAERAVKSRPLHEWIQYPTNDLVKDYLICSIYESVERMYKSSCVNLVYIFISISSKLSLCCEEIVVNRELSIVKVF